MTPAHEGWRPTKAQAALLNAMRLGRELIRSSEPPFRWYLLGASPESGTAQAVGSAMVDALVSAGALRIEPLRRRFVSHQAVLVDIAASPYSTLRKPEGSP